MVTLRRFGKHHWAWIKVVLLAFFIVILFQLLSPGSRQETILIPQIKDIQGDSLLEIHPRRLNAVHGSREERNVSQTVEASQPTTSHPVSSMTTTEATFPPALPRSSFELEDDRQLMPMPKFKVKVVSGKTVAEVHVNDKMIYFSGRDVKERGIHVVVLNQASGAFIAAKVFDTYLSPGEHGLEAYVDTIVAGRVVCIAIKDEGTFHLLDTGKKALRNLGSKYVDSIEWRSTFVMIVKKGAVTGTMIDEEWRQAPDVHSWAADIALAVSVEAVYPAPLCDWTKKPQNKIRTRFCSLFDGYPELCNCGSTIETGVSPPSLAVNYVANVPVLLVANNDTHLLLKGLYSLTSAAGALSQRIVVASRGMQNETEGLACLFGVKALPGPSKEANDTSNIATLAQYYGDSIATTLALFPDAQSIIVVEVNAKVSSDIFDYFSQTVHLLKDSAIFCVSAWNYMGYRHSSFDSEAVYRVETPPGVAWMASRQSFEKMMLPKWPKLESNLFSWAAWMGPRGIAAGRECIVPEVSRAILESPSQFWKSEAIEAKLFDSHLLNSKNGVKLKNVNKMNGEDYELQMESLLKSSQPVDHSLLPTDPNFIPFSRGHVFSVYIGAHNSSDFSTWTMLTKLLHLWSADCRGVHNAMWRFHFRGSQILVIACPVSKYCSHKPDDIAPIKLRLKLPQIPTTPRSVDGTEFALKFDKVQT